MNALTRHPPKPVAWAAIILLLFYAGLFSCGPAENKTVKTPNQIYKEADYLARISIQDENIQTGEVSDNYASGFLVSLNGKYLVLTAAHIDHPGYRLKEVAVRFKGQHGIYFATLDKKNAALDCAVLKIIDPKFFFMGRLASPKLDTKFEVGDQVYSLGSPFEFNHLLGSGVIRGLDQRSGRWRSTIITSAEAGVAPGSSGGPLVNVYGEVIGMNVGMRVDGDERNERFFPSFSFAIYMKDILSWLITQY